MSRKEVKVIVRQYRRKHILKLRTFDTYDEAECEALKLAKHMPGLSIQIHIDGEIYSFVKQGQIVTRRHGPRPI